jgi:hypothetical protein
MSASEFLKKGYVVALVAGVLSAVVATRLEPFKSSFTLAIVAGAVVGSICAMIEVAVRSIAKRLRRTTV